MENLRGEGLRTTFDVVRRADGLRLANGERCRARTCSICWAAIAVGADNWYFRTSIEKLTGEFRGHRPAS